MGGTRFWNYLQSYQWTDDAEIDGHLDPISTRINDTVVRVYVENTYHIKAGQPLVDFDPRYRALRINDAWSVDFVHDQLSNGQSFLALTVIDVYSREALAIEVGQRSRGEHVVAVLNRLGAETRRAALPVHR